MPDLRPRPFSIRIFLPDGDPDGLRVVTKSNWTGVGVVFKRSGYHLALQRKEFQNMGVYILVGAPEDSSQPMIYVGESKKVRERFGKHLLKEFWEWAIFFTTHDASLNKAHVHYLEYRLIALAKDAKQAKLNNENSGFETTLSEAVRADMESFLADILSILPLVGLSVFEVPDPADSAAPSLQLKGRGVRAGGYESSSGFVVKVGSQAAKDGTPSIPSHLQIIRQDLLDQGVLVENGKHLQFSQNHPFNSPSTAAGVVLGRNANGRIEWKDDDGRTLKDIQMAAASEADLG